MKIEIELDASYKKMVKKFVMFLCKELSILPRKITIISCDLDGTNGMCIDRDEGTFTILVKEDSRDVGQVFTTVAHEMIHVKQYMTQDLGRMLDESSQLPYEDRWWEHEAYEKAVPLVEKFALTELFGGNK